MRARAFLIAVWLVILASIAAQDWIAWRYHTPPLALLALCGSFLLIGVFATAMVLRGKR